MNNLYEIIVSVGNSGDRVRILSECEPEIDEVTGDITVYEVNQETVFNWNNVNYYSIRDISGLDSLENKMYYEEPVEHAKS